MESAKQVYNFAYYNHCFNSGIGERGELPHTSFITLHQIHNNKLGMDEEEWT